MSLSPGVTMLLATALWTFLRALLFGSAAIALENLALRHQLVVLQRAVARPRLTRWDRKVRWSYHVLSLVLVCEDDGRACVGARCARFVILLFALSVASDDSPAHDG
jgi:hypothetical protein